MSRMTVRFDRVFNKKGNFNLKEFNLESFDPYRKRDDDNYRELFDLLFDEQGNVLDEFHFELAKYIQLKNFPAFCDAVKLYYAHVHGRNTSNSYPAVYMFRQLQK